MVLTWTLDEFVFLSLRGFQGREVSGTTSYILLLQPSRLVLRTYAAGRSERAHASASLRSIRVRLSAFTARSLPASGDSISSECATLPPRPAAAWSPRSDR